MSNKFYDWLKTIADIKSPFESKIGSFLSAKQLNDNAINTKNIMVLFYFVAIAARLSEVDGKTNKDEMQGVISLFPHFLNVPAKVTSIYNASLEDNLKAHDFVDKIRHAYPNRYKLYKQICMMLIKVADSDGPVNTKEFVFISEMARRFGFTAINVEAWVEEYIFQNKLSEDYWSNEASQVSHGSYFREKLLKFHPDRLYSYPDVAKVYKEAYKRKYDLISEVYSQKNA